MLQANQMPRGMQATHSSHRTARFSCPDHSNQLSGKDASAEDMLPNTFPGCLGYLGSD